jgi:hypothetical protein
MLYQNKRLALFCKRLSLLLWLTAATVVLADEPTLIQASITFDADPVYQSHVINFQYDKSALSEDQAAILSFQAKYKIKDDNPPGFVVPADIRSFHYQGRPREILCIKLNDNLLTDNIRVFPESRIIRTNMTAYEVCNPYNSAWNLLNSDSFDVNSYFTCNVPFERPLDYEIDVTDLLTGGVNGANSLALIPWPPAGGGQEYYTIDLENIEIQVRQKTAIVLPPAPGTVPTAPAGGWPVYAPPSGQANYTFSLDAYGGINLTVNSQNYQLQSLLYWPQGGGLNGGINCVGVGVSPTTEAAWQPQVTQIDSSTYRITAAGAYYSLVRTIHLYSDYLDVFDDFTNLKNADTPIVGRTCILTSQAPQQIYAAGVPRINAEGSVGFAPQNPTIYAAQSNSGVGLMTREDAMRSATGLFWKKDATVPYAGFEVWNHILPSYGQCTLRWTIAPTSTADYWRFVDTMRKVLNTNFTIPGLAAFITTSHPINNMTNQQIKDYVANRGIKFFLTDSYRKGTSFEHFVQGADALNSTVDASIAQFTTMVSKIKTATPDTKVLIYFHDVLCSDPDSNSLYAGCRSLDSYGAIATSGDFFFLFPTLTNSYGEALLDVIDIATNPAKIGADGVYWDEMCTGTAGNADVWSGRSADVNRYYYTAGAHWSLTAQLITPWQSSTVQSLLNQGKWVIANTNPTTETMTQLHFPRFVEYNNYDSCADGQLYTPIAVTQAERCNSSANILKQATEYLNHGSLIYELAPYNQGPAASIGIDFDNLLRNMYPFTPVYIQPGAMIGKERILISQPGKFGWGDGSMPSQIKIFDENGNLVAPAVASAWITPDAPNGLVQITLPYNYTGVLINDNIALNRPYTISPAPNYWGGCTDSGDATQLTDGAYVTGSPLWTQAGAVGWYGAGTATITIDLGQVQPIRGASFNTAGGAGGVPWPSAINMSVSNDGINYSNIGELAGISNSEHSDAPASSPYAVHRYWTKQLSSVNGRFVKIAVPGSSYIFVDEIAIY